MADLDITGRVTVDASQAEGAFDRVGQRAGQMSDAVAGAATRAGDAVGRIGAGAEAGAETLTRSQSRMRDQIIRSTEAIENLGKTASQKLEIKIATQGLDPNIYAPYLARLREVEAAQAALRASGREAAAGAEEAGSAFDLLASKLAGFNVSAKDALVGLAAGFSAGAFVGWIKGAIDSADAASKLASSAGLAVEELAGLQLAFEGADAGNQLQATLSKLASEAQKGNAAFAAMGIAVNNSSGGLKSTRDLLAEVSDKFAGYRDGAEKTALAQQLLGESGAALIPLFNGGSAALDEFDESAKALGLTLSTEAAEAAGNFNDQIDLITQRSQGLARQLASELLPVLSTVSEQFGSAAKQGSSFSLIGTGLSVVLETITVIGSDVAFVLRTLARDALLVYNSAVKLATLDFSGIKSGFEAYKTETSDARKALEQFQAAVITARAVASAGDLDEPWVKRARIDAQQAAEAAKQLAPQISAVAAARGTNRKAIDGETAALRARLAAATSANAAFDEEFKSVEAARMETEARIKTGRELLQSIELETAMLGLSNVEREQAIALFALERAGVVAGTEAYAAYADKIRAAIAARGDKQAALDAVKAETEATKKAAEDATAEWKKTADSINSSLTDALMRGFEDGKGFAENLKTTLVNMFKTMVLRPIIQAVVNPVAGAITGALGFAGSANAAGGGGQDLASMFSNLSSGINNSIGTAFSKFASTSTGQSLGLSNTGYMAGPMGPVNPGGQLTSMGQSMSTALGVVGNTLAGYAIGSMANSLISGGYSAGKGMDNLQKAGIAVASAFFGPVGGAIAGVISGGINRLFGRKLKDSGIEGTFGGQEGFTGNSFQFMKGGWLRDDKNIPGAIDPEIEKYLSDSFKLMRVKVGTFATALGLNTDRIAGFTSSIKLSLKDLKPEEADAKIKEALATTNNALAEQVLGSYQETVTKVIDTIQTGWDSETSSTGNVFSQVERQVTTSTYTPSEFAREGETAIDTLSRLSLSLIVANDVFDTLGETLFDTSLAGADMASSLIDAFGGGDAFAAATSTYFQAFYSEAERTEIATRQLTTALAGMGLELPDSIAAYRALAESQDLTTDSGRNTYAALLTLSGAFAEVTNAVSATIKQLQAETAGLEVALLRAQGNEPAAQAAQRAIDTQGFTTAELAIYDYNAALRDQITAAGDAARAAEEAAAATIRAAEEAAAAAEAAYERATSAAQSAYGALERSVGAERERLTTAFNSERTAIQERLRLQQEGYAAQLESAQAAADKIKGIASALSNAVKQVQIESPELNRARFDSARQVIARGDLNDPALTDALDAVSGDNKQFYGRFEQFAFDQAVTAASIASLDVAAQEQLSAAEQTILAIKASGDVAKLLADAELSALDANHAEQLAQLQAILDDGKAQLDALLGIDNSVLTVADAVAALAAAIGSANAAKAVSAAAVMGGGGSSAGGGASGGPLGTSASDSDGQHEMARSQYLTGKQREMFSNPTVLAELGVSVADLNNLLDGGTNFMGALSALGADPYAFFHNAMKNDIVYKAPTNLNAGNVYNIEQVNEARRQLGLNTFDYNPAEVFGSISNAAAYSAQTPITNQSYFDLNPDVAASFAANSYGMDAATFSAIHFAKFGEAEGRILPGFAVGINRVPRDMLAQIHEGEAVVPAALNPFNPNAQTFGGNNSNAEVVDQLRQLNERMARIEASSNATAGHTAGTDRKLARVIRNDAITTEAAA